VIAWLTDKVSRARAGQLLRNVPCIALTARLLALGGFQFIDAEICDQPIETIH
jgi:hypothetical protein